MLDGNVYFIACPEPRSIKIGYTRKHPINRLKQLQTGCPSALVLLGWFPGDQCDESDLLRDLASYRLSGEWFSMDAVEDERFPFNVMMINNRLTGYQPGAE